MPLVFIYLQVCDTLARIRIVHSLEFELIKYLLERQGYQGDFNLDVELEALEQEDNWEHGKHKGEKLHSYALP